MLHCRCRWVLPGETQTGGCVVTTPVVDEAALKALAAVRRSFEHDLKARIARRLRNRGLTVIAIADVLETSRNTIHRYLREDEASVAK